MTAGTLILTHYGKYHWPKQVTPPNEDFPLGNILLKSRFHLGSKSFKAPTVLFSVSFQSFVHLFFHIVFYQISHSHISIPEPTILEPNS